MFKFLKVNTSSQADAKSASKYTSLGGHAKNQALLLQQYVCHRNEKRATDELEECRHFEKQTKVMNVTLQA